MSVYETAKQLKQQLATIQLLLKPEIETIKEYMDKNVILLAPHGGEIATYKQNKPSIYFDEKLFQIERPKIYKAYLTEKEGNRPLVLT